MQCLCVDFGIVIFFCDNFSSNYFSCVVVIVQPMPQCSPPLVHPVVHQGVHTAVCHGQPVEGQVHVRRVPEQNKKLLFLFKNHVFPSKIFLVQFSEEKNILLLLITSK